MRHCTQIYIYILYIVVTQYACHCVNRVPVDVATM